MILEVTAKGVLHLFGETSGQRVKVAAEVESGRVYLAFSCFGKPLFGSCDHLPSSLGCAIDDRERNLTCDEGVFVSVPCPGSSTSTSVEARAASVLGDCLRHDLVEALEEVRCVGAQVRAAGVDVDTGIDEARDVALVA